jgi:DNA-binding NtrC family response regulator
VSSTRRPRLLIVDDDAGQRSLIESFLQGQNFETTTAESGDKALQLLATQSFDMMISDVRMPGLSGLETLRRARERHATLPVLLVTGYADVREAVGAMRDGALDYLSKPIDLDELLASVQRATGLAIEKKEVVLGDDKKLSSNVIAESPLMKALFRDAALIAGSDSRVLITGESGAGKEVLADLIHSWSPRAGGPLVKVNCAAIPETLLESELFGHEKGSFTGASQQRIGRFEQANNGTIFLDEIAEMSPQLQAKLLRVTQDGKFQRVGSNKEITANVRLLAATNRDLEEEVEKGRFREDLFYRLNVVELHIAPLRERREDILPLANLFVAEFTKGKARLSAGAIEVLETYSWPGNVRELRNAIERAALLARAELILPEHLPARITAEERPEPVDAANLEEVERQAIFAALRKNNFNRSETAKALGISRRAMIYKLQRYRALGYKVDAE